MTNPPPDSGSVRPPSTGEYSFEPIATASPAPSNGSTSAVIAIVAIALVVIVGGVAGLVLLRGGGSESDATPLGSDASTASPTVASSTIEAPAATLVSGGVAPEGTVTPPTAPPPPPQPALPPAQVGPPMISASVVRQGGLDSCTPPNDTLYTAAMAYDGSTDTAWMAPGDGVGQRLVFTFPSPVTVSEVGLFPGYGKFDPCTADDRFFQLRRIGSVQWSFDDGSVVDQTFTATKAVQQIPVAPRVTRSVTITIVTTVAPGVARLDHTPISEVTIS